MKIRYIIVIAILLLAATITHSHRDLILPQTRELASFPDNIGHWHMSSNTVFSEPLLKILRPTDYLMRSYADSGGHFIDLYVGYHNGGASSGPIHSPRNCLPGSGWFPLGNSEMSVAVPGGNLALVRAVYAKEDQKVTFYYWYQLKGEVITNDLGMKLAELRNTLLHRRRDAAFIRVNVRDLSGTQADKLAADFINGLYPALNNYLPG